MTYGDLRGDPRTETWAVGGRSFMGAAHLHLGAPNQDAIAWGPGEQAAPAAVLAVADGHGAALHFRSGVGAHIAVDVATAVLNEAARDPRWIAAADAATGRRIVHDLIGRWREAVRAHLAANPLGGEKAQPEDRALMAYGATLIAAAATCEGVFVLQLGDGDLVLGTSAGAVLRPLPDDEGMIGEQTYSLCQRGAEQFTRMRILPRSEIDVDLVMLATDGMGKSFPGAGAVEALARAWRATLAREPLPAVLRQLDTWLPQTSRQGSGDDISLGFLVRSDLRGHASEARPVEWPHPAPRTIVRNLGLPPASRRQGWRRWGVALATGVVLAAVAAGGYWLR
ncbi:MAG: protein phosphatase 2C domain-containing protein [Variibacter sp.]|nr:protein phosphatase 2C domain-containing protein [Variibacter sp.]